MVDVLIVMGIVVLGGIALGTLVSLVVIVAVIISQVKEVRKEWGLGAKTPKLGWPIKYPDEQTGKRDDPKT